MRRGTWPCSATPKGCRASGRTCGRGWSSAASAGRRAAGGANTSTTHFYITSLRCGAKKLAGYIRGHWGVENGLHWCLDVSFGEDANRTRDKNAGANLGVVRRAAASLLKQDERPGSIK